MPRTAAVAVEEGAVPVVYLLRCVDGSLYCGWSVDLGRRLAAHSRGRASRYTASRRPVELAAAWETVTATDARRLEARIKRLTRAKKLRLVASSGRSPDPWGLRPIKFIGHEPDGWS